MSFYIYEQIQPLILPDTLNSMENYPQPLSTHTLYFTKYIDFP